MRPDNTADGLLAAVGLVEDSLAGDLVDVRRKEVDAQREPGLRARQLDLLGLEAVDDVVESFLGGDGQPDAAHLLLAGLSKTLEIKHSMHRARDVLAGLVDDERKALRPSAASLQELKRAGHEPVGIDVRSVQFSSPLRQRFAVAVHEIEGFQCIALSKCRVATLAPRLFGDRQERFLEPLE